MLIADVSSPAYKRSRAAYIGQSTFDHFEASGNLKGGFLFISIVMLVCNLLGVACMLMMKTGEEGFPNKTKKQPFDQSDQTAVFCRQI